jgi:nucleoside transporter
MPLGLRIRLSTMMFLTYAIWGTWAALLPRYLGTFLHFTPIQVGHACATTGAIASVVAMFISGQIADRWFSAERFLAVSHLIGGLLLFAVARQEAFWPFFFVFLFYLMLFIPTVSLANSLCLAHLPNGERDFGSVRAWGTIGWAAMAWPFVFLLKGLEGEALKAGMKWMFYVAGATSIVLAVFSLSLPHTPPNRESRDRFAPFEALALLARPAFLVLLIVSLIDSVVLGCYWRWTSDFLKSLRIHESWHMVGMSISQIAEVATMFALGICLKRFGWRKVMAIGVFAHVIRYGIYTLSAGRPELAWLVVASNVVHGAAYAFFFAAVYIYVGEYAPKDVGASVQMLFNLVMIGLGGIIGAQLWSQLGAGLTETATGRIDFQRLFMIPTIMALLTGILLLAAFWPGQKPASEETAPTGFGSEEEAAKVEERLRDLGYVE